MENVKVTVNEYEEYVISMVNESEEEELVVGHEIDDWDTMNQTICTENQLIEVKHGCGTCEQTFPRLDDLNKHKLFCPLNYNTHIPPDNDEELPADEAMLSKKKSRLCFCCEEDITNAHKGNIRCPKCDSKFHTKFGRDRHMYLLHAEDTEFQCNSCNVICRTIRILDLHMISQHAPIKPFTCDFCRRSFLLKTNLAKHLKQPLCSGPNNEKALSCTECKQKFTNMDDLYEHVHDGANLSSKKFLVQCSFCDKSFCALSLLSMHSRIHKDVKTFPCEECKKSYANIYLLRKHRLIHTVQGYYKCRYCEKCFEFNHQRLRHHKSHMEITKGSKLRSRGRPKRIRRRGRGRPRKSDKVETPKLQMKLVMDDENVLIGGPYKCPFCEKIYNSIQERIQHVISNHANEWPHKCEICNECFLRTDDHKVHMLKHINDPVVIETVSLKTEEVESKKISSSQRCTPDDENSYKCRYCDKSFKFSQQRMRHTLKFHKEKHLYTCKICNKTYMRAEALEIHMILHSAHDPNTDAPLFRGKIEIKEEPPLTIEPESHFDSDKGRYECRFCEKSFQFTQERVRHVVMHHTNERSHEEVSPVLQPIPRGQKSYKCLFCKKIFKTTDERSRHVKFSHGNQDASVEFKTQENHPGQTSHNCLFCSNCYTKEAELKAHMIQHIGNTMSIKDEAHIEVEAECVATGKSNHPVHSGPESYNCSFCDKSFKFPQQRLHHVKTSHTDEGWDINHHIPNDVMLDVKPIPLKQEPLTECEISKEQNHQKTKRKRKLFKRNSDGPNKCRFCERSFKYRTQRWRHVKLQHPDHWPLKKHIAQLCDIVEEVDPLQLKKTTIPDSKVSIESETHCENSDGQDQELMRPRINSNNMGSTPQRDIEQSKGFIIEATNSFSCFNSEKNNNQQHLQFEDSVGKSTKYSQESAPFVTIHRDQRPHKCKICFARFFRASGINRHMVYRHGKILKSFAVRNKEATVSREHKDSPNISDVTIPDQSLRHVKTTHPLTESHLDAEIDCCLRNETAKNGSNCCKEGEIINIGRLQEVDEKPKRASEPIKTSIECLFCDKSFFQAEELEAHMFDHINGEAKSYELHTDNEVLSENTVCSTSVHHPDQYQHTCEICNTSFIRACELKQHMVYHVKDEVTNSRTLVEHGINIKTPSQINEECSINYKSQSPVDIDETPNKCRFCEKSFKYRAQRWRHVKINHPDQWPHKCELCSVSFFGAKALIKHMGCHRKNRVIGDVNSLQKQNEMMLDNDSIEMEFPPLPCPHCNKPFKCPYRKLRHIKESHAIGGLHKCQFCGTGFFRAEKLESHLINHIDATVNINPQVLQNKDQVQTVSELPYKCCDCDKSFMSKKQRSRHFQIHHPDQYHHECEICEARFCEARDLKQHKMYHVRSGVIVDSDTEILSLVSEDHDDEIIIEASPKKEEKSKTEGIIHNKSKSPFDSHEMLNKCQFCETSFKYRSQRWRHVKMYHPDQWPHKCELCQVSFFGAKAFIKHKARHRKNKIVTDVNTFQNESEIDQDKIEAERAMYIKSLGPIDTEEMFQCPYCDKPFKCPKQRARHIKTLHLIEGPHKCQFCGTSFFQAETLETHMANHIGATIDAQMLQSNDQAVKNLSNKCRYCDRSFKFRTQRSRHVRRSHEGLAA